MSLAPGLADLLRAAGAFVVLWLIYRPLERTFPAWPRQPALREGWWTDLAFFLGQYLIWLTMVLAILLDLAPWLHGLVPPAWRAAICSQPFWLQFLEVVVAGDLLIYWGHRLQHRVPWLWRFHAVHHSSPRLDWLAAHREHPVDTLYSVGLMNLPIYMLGFSPEVFGSFIAFRGLWAILIHANVRLPLGPLGLLLGSPAFHHWHHDREQHDCNYGNVAPWLDVIFGTHHDPGYEPDELGLTEPMATDYLGLLVNPFLPRGLQRGLTLPSAAAFTPSTLWTPDPGADQPGSNHPPSEIVDPGSPAPGTGLAEASTTP